MISGTESLCTIDHRPGTCSCKSESSQLQMKIKKCTVLSSAAYSSFLFQVVHKMDSIITLGKVPAVTLNSSGMPAIKMYSRGFQYVRA